ncbi:MAG: hypothetical protein M1829_000154 [Trizodia sp. TS-e1964]|nr:MAG: hypothetical protein M1829_000154 [Trizodia sp. TS-e1964]
MSEYWKSTPKYWCKHCKTFVRDTKLEKQNHEATPKHQGNLKRFLRDLHRGHERDEREQQRAKSEVERLNGLVSDDPLVKTSNNSSHSQTNRGGPSTAGALPQQRQATVSERKSQLNQLANLGIAIPEEFRGELAMAGDWQVISEKPFQPTSSKDDIKDLPPSQTRKRQNRDGEDSDEESRKKPWGLSIKEYPTVKNQPDLDSLLDSGSTIKREIGAGSTPSLPPRAPDSSSADADSFFKKEELDKDIKTGVSGIPIASPGEVASAGGEIAFKKRKFRGKGTKT